MNDRNMNVRSIEKALGLQKDELFCVDGGNYHTLLFSVAHAFLPDSETTTTADALAYAVNHPESVTFVKKTLTMEEKDFCFGRGGYYWVTRNKGDDNVCLWNLRPARMPDGTYALVESDDIQGIEAARTITLPCELFPSVGEGEIFVTI